MSECFNKMNELTIKRGPIKIFSQMLTPFQNVGNVKLHRVPGWCHSRGAHVYIMWINRVRDDPGGQKARGFRLLIRGLTRYIHTIR